MFFHFDISVYKESFNERVWEDFPEPNAYQPTRLDTDQWLAAAKAYGAQYAVFVAKHCTGFLQWQSDLYPYGVRQSSWQNGKGDVVASFIESCRKFGIKPGLYASVSTNVRLGVGVADHGIVNPKHGGGPEAQRHYVKICEQMMAELWSRYGELYEIWFDGGAIPVSEGGPDLVPLLKKYQPHSIVFQGPPGSPNLIRWVGNERGVAPYPCWSAAGGTTAENGLKEGVFAGSPTGTCWVPGECDVPLRQDQWFWRPGTENRVRTVENLMDIYESSVGRNCNLILNANINREGLIPEPDFKRYEEFGQAIRARYGHPLAETAGTGNEVTLALASPARVSAVALMEDITQGERVRQYELWGTSPQGQEVKLGAGSCISHKRIQRFASVRLAKVTLRVTSAVAEPQIRQLAVFHG